jgi:hypothetical protein
MTCPYTCLGLAEWVWMEATPFIPTPPRPSQPSRPAGSRFCLGLASASSLFGTPTPAWTTTKTYSPCTLPCPYSTPPLQARGGGEAPGCHGESGISMQVRCGRSPPRVVHVVGRQGGGVLCVSALWCTGTPRWPWPSPSPPPPPQVATAVGQKGGKEETALDRGSGGICIHAANF